MTNRHPPAEKTPHAGETVADSSRTPTPGGDGPTPRERLTAVVVAGHGDDPAPVLAALVDSDPDVRAAAIGARRRQGHLTTDDLVTALGDPELAVRRRAADEAARWAPTMTGEGAVVAALVSALDDDVAVAERAAFALGEFAERAATAGSALAGMAGTHDDALCREAAVAALGAIGVELDAVLAALGDKATVRRRAVIALAAFDDERVDPALEAALSDRDWQVRQAAEDLLGVTGDGGALSDDPGAA